LIDLKKNTCYNVKNIFCRARICVLDVTKNDLLSRYLIVRVRRPQRIKKQKEKNLFGGFYEKQKTETLITLSLFRVPPLYAVCRDGRL
jgi:hypothetical protein